MGLAMISLTAPSTTAVEIGSPFRDLSREPGRAGPLRRPATAVRNDTLDDAFPRRYPGFRPANGNEIVALTS
jgi:hypothetical protein